MLTLIVPRPGNSPLANPAIRPDGRKKPGIATVLAETIFEESAETLARTAVDRALTGDGATTRFLLGRILPKTAGRTITLDLAPGKELDLPHVHALVVRVMADGEITPQEALQIGRLLAIGAKLQKLANPKQTQAREAAQAEPSPACGGGQGGGTRGSTGAGGASPHPDLPPQAGEGARLFPACISNAASPGRAEGAPVSDLNSAREKSLPDASVLAPGEGARLFPACISNAASTGRAKGGPVSGLYFSTGRAAA